MFCIIYMPEYVCQNMYASKLEFAAFYTQNHSCWLYFYSYSASPDCFYSMLLSLSYSSSSYSFYSFSFLIFRSCFFFDFYSLRVSLSSMYLLLRADLLWKIPSSTERTLSLNPNSTFYGKYSLRVLTVCFTFGMQSLSPIKP